MVLSVARIHLPCAGGSCAMDNQAIEAKDRDVVKKFRQVVEEKERFKQKKNHLKRVMRILGLCAAVMVVFVSFFLRNSFHPVDHPIPSNPELQDSKKTIPVLPQHPEPQPSALSQGDPGDGDRIGISENNNKMPALKRPQFKKNTADFQNISIVTADRRKISPSSFMKKNMAGSVNIARMTACREVIDKQCTGSQEKFSVKTDGQVRIWMDVRSKQVPYTLKHVYFANGRRYRTIPLTIKYPEMRTWSGIALNGSQDVGKWRVDVVSEDGQTLSQIEFKVVP